MVAGTVLGSLLAPSTARAHGDTVHLYFNNHQPSVGLLSEGDGSVTTQSSFPAPWNWNTFQNSFFTSSPGWSYDSNWDFTDDLTFRIVTSLQRWNGVSFVDAPFDARMIFAIWSMVSGPGLTNGFSITIGSNDHFHFGYSLAGVPNTPPSIGVYRLNLQAGRVRNQRVTWFPVFSYVLNRGESAAVAQQALAYSESGRFVVRRTGQVLELRSDANLEAATTRRP